MDYQKRRRRIPQGDTRRLVGVDGLVYEVETIKSFDIEFKLFSSDAFPRSGNLPTHPPPCGGDVWVAGPPGARRFWVWGTSESWEIVHDGAVMVDSKTPPRRHPTHEAFLKPGEPSQVNWVNRGTFLAWRSSGRRAAREGGEDEDEEMETDTPRGTHAPRPTLPPLRQAAPPRNPVITQGSRTMPERVQLSRGRFTDPGLMHLNYLRAQPNASSNSRSSVPLPTQLPPVQYIPIHSPHSVDLNGRSRVGEHQHHYPAHRGMGAVAHSSLGYRTTAEAVHPYEKFKTEAASPPPNRGYLPMDESGDMGRLSKTSWADVVGIPSTGKFARPA